MTGLKLYQFKGGETDWVAAHSQVEAETILKSTYELADTDLENYDDVSEVDPETITVYLDEVCCETEEQLTKTAAEVMSEMKSGDVVCSTAW
jgi:hypothetical protein